MKKAQLIQVLVVGLGIALGSILTPIIASLFAKVRATAGV